jgi:hypothetical protein
MPAIAIAVARQAVSLNVITAPGRFSECRYV